MLDYSSLTYWDNRYRNDPSQFDWICDLSPLTELFEKHLPKNCPLLDVGCGTSRVPLQFAKQGYSVTAIDFSLPCIDSVSTLYRHSNLNYIHTDIFTFEPIEQMSVVFDKCLIDSVSCSFDKTQTSSLIDVIHSLLIPSALFSFDTSKWEHLDTIEIPKDRKIEEGEFYCSIYKKIQET
ncbi:hypothetical protein GEMRC1_007986 [Eukaryota sp. GEM-RC1]